MAKITNIFVNLPVQDLDKSKSFFAALGFRFNPQFTDEKAACLVIGANIYAMLISEPFMKTFTAKSIADSRKTTEVLLSVSVDSRSEVDELLKKVEAAGGKDYRAPEDLGFMYNRSFEDPDGHIWEAFWMDPAHVKPFPAE